MATALSAILGLLTALPQLLKMINDFAGWIKKISGNDPAGFAVKASVAFSKLNQAKTQQEHQDAAKALSDLLTQLPK